jgi:hypothetical protein
VTASKDQRARPKIGEKFNPFNRFHGIWIPEPMALYPQLPPGAKLVYGRLMRYAGKDGFCWPSVLSLAVEVGLGERQVQKHLSTLESDGFIRREKRFRDGAQTSNGYIFLWHLIFDAWERQQQAKAGMNSSSPSPAHHSSPRPVNYSAHKESQYEESHLEEDHCGAGLGMNSDSPKESQMGELDPVHRGSPKEGHGDAFDFGRLDNYSSDSTESEEEPEWQKRGAAMKARLKAMREALDREPI